MATAIEFDNTGSILEGFSLALGAESNSGAYSPLFDISSLLLGHKVNTTPSYGIRWSAFLAQMESFASKDYIPVIEFPAGRNAADLAGDTISLIEDIIVRQTSLKGNVTTGLKYMVDECTDNIMEHSRSEYGYISSRIDRIKGIIDVCVGDSGIGILGSYLANNDPDIKTNLEALQAANRGISTKNRPNAENRGYGLMTTKKMITTGLGGSFAMISGGTVFMQDVNGRHFVDSADSLKMQGTIVALRFPIDNSDFKYINYIE